MMSSPNIIQIEQVASTLKSVFGWLQPSFTIQQNKTATNNHVFIVELAQPLQSDLIAEGRPRPFISAIPAGTSRLVMRVPKRDNNVEDSIRIKNEVAFLVLAREALATAEANLVPRVFYWEDDDAADRDTSVCQSYIIEEFKSGETISFADFKALSYHDKQSICDQLAHVVAAWQSFELPASVRGYGGLTFDNNGTFSSTKNIFRTGGPFSTYSEYLKATIRWQLENSEHVEAINGWRTVADAPDLRKRIDAFIDQGLDTLLDTLPRYKLSLVHGDLTLPNLLFDRSNNKLTAVIDFDFGHIGAPITEFLYSFPEFDGLLSGVADTQEGLRDHMLHQPCGQNWPDESIGGAWQKALLDHGASVPATIDGSDTISNVWWFAQELLYFHWLVPRAVNSMSEETKRKKLRSSAETIQTYLRLWGY
ncbi:hypothetical protein NLG97_g134 [Lecanicillium saksenae]|uniref:Uncharacterized protein n=1 Tax=Lecanicillium saksenae TaxID=468837 RepID=A0ACC1R810_9HYPO|nr:hypothetical protein NLG97_g134 [Lecanicillium saksenae]